MDDYEDIPQDADVETLEIQIYEREERITSLHGEIAALRMWRTSALARENDAAQALR